MSEQAEAGWNLLCALNHAERGRAVFPCDPVTKQPCIPRKEGGKGFKDATTSETLIREWWRRYPNAVPGMPTGGRVGVFVLDVDVKRGAQGEETLARLEECFGSLPDTVEAITPSGGRHLYFRHPRDGRLVPNKGSRLGSGTETWGRNGLPPAPFEVAQNGQLIAPGVDIRGDGGYVILPGARMADGSAYCWEISSDPDDGDQSVADAPAWLLSLVAVDLSPAGSVAPVPQDGEPIPEGHRNEFLYRLGCSLRAKGLGEPAIVAALLAENAARCQPPLPEPEVRASAASAASKAPGLSPEYSARRAAREPKREPKAGLRVVAGTEHRARPVIQLQNGLLPQNTDSAVDSLLASGADIYQHGNRLVRVGRWDAAPGIVDRPSGAGVLLDVSAEWLVDTLSRQVVFQRFDQRSQEWRPVDCPSKIAKTLLARVGEWRFSHLLGFCDSPTLALDGRLISTAGYDRPTGLFLSNCPEIAPIGKLSREDAEDAGRALFSLFDTFPCATPADQSALMAMVLTALLRRVLPSAPICCISASTPGTGKSLLADAISALVTGRRAPVAAVGKDAEELEKRLDSVLLKGDALCVFDNVDRAIRSDVLCQVTTQGFKSIRVLAQSRIVEAPTNVCLFMTGNNLALIGDLVRRTLVCNLDAGCERPELRPFKRDAIDWVLSQRPDGIRDALSISKAYLDAGCPEVGLSPFGSFDVWDRMVRRPLVWLGYADPLGPADGMRDQDHEFEGMVNLMAAWYAELPDRAVTAAELYELASSRGEGLRGVSPTRLALYDAAFTVMGAVGKWGAKELGYRLRQWAGRIIGGYRVCRGQKSNRGVLWGVEVIGPPP